MTSWDPTATKVLLRSTSQRLGQIQERIDSQGQITRRDIATLLQQNNTALARAKAQNLIQDDAMGDLLEVVEMHVSMVIEHLGELEEGRSPSPILTEAAASIIAAASSVNIKELDVVRDMLFQRMHHHFFSSSNSLEKYVPLRVMQLLHPPTPSASKMNDCLTNVSNVYRVNWTADPPRQDILDDISEILDSQGSPIVDLPRLRRLCSQGLPDEPPWLRPRIWKLLLGTVPVLKSTWPKENRKLRDSYYDLVRRLLSPFSDMPAPTKPLSSIDTTLMKISESLFRLPFGLFDTLESGPNCSTMSPLDENADETERIGCAHLLDARLLVLRGQISASKPTGIPEIRLEPDAGAPELSPLPSSTSIASRRPGAPTTLLHAGPFGGPSAHPQHISALLRLLYLHSCINPANQSPDIPSLLVPLYAVLVREVEPEDLAHAEADTFWLFEALVGEFSELADQEGGKVWMKKFSDRLAQADGDLASSLHAKGLDPVLPHYSYRWLAPLLSQTLPLTSLLPVWDVLFSYPMRTRDENHKLDALVDICTSLLIRARAPLFRLAKPGGKSPGLWAEEHATIRPSSPLRPWELSDAFLEGITLLQSYPIDAAGGIDRVLQTANDLAQRRIEENRVLKSDNVTLGARIKATMWKGFTNQVADADGVEEEEDEEDEESSSDEEDSHEDGNETETPAAPTLTSRLANSVWRGITNQSSMDNSPSPPSPTSPLQSQSPTPPPPQSPPEQIASNLPLTPPPSSIWGYAGKLKDSDTVAAFTKVSTNWRARAMDAWGSRRGSLTPNEGVSSPTIAKSELPPPVPDKWSPQNDGASNSRYGDRGGSLPSSSRGTSFEEPPRPAFFRSPRDSFLPLPRRGTYTTPPSPEVQPQQEDNFMHKAQASLASLAALNSLTTASRTVASRPATPPHPPRGAPRPLLLNSSSLITAKPPLSAHSDGGMPVKRHGDWVDVTRSKGHGLRTDSVSSVSSMSPSDALGRPYSKPSIGSRSDIESDGRSRKVALNRKSISPMAPASRALRGPCATSPLGVADATTRDPLIRTYARSAAEDSSSDRGWRSYPPADSPTTVSSPPIPPTPITAVHVETGKVRVNGESRESSFSEDSIPLRPPTPSKALLRKKTPPPLREDTDNSDTLARTPSRNPHVRSKRHLPKLPSLRTRDSNLRPVSAAEHKNVSPNTLAPPEWLEDQEMAMTPRAPEFGSNDPASASTIFASHSPRPRRKTSGDTLGRSRKTSGESVVRLSRYSFAEARETRDSAAEEGDDEGYDDILSAYESEEGSKE
ncbi:regulator of Vps4 activity in the MVB pathway-domain-containing protein [Suillus clintonianus]|uniref:regulator of Vps4 activity in the MVB pathway-domain-containing protein n=1 Tax=Suillus clintonianus TaxID=1904413 RepID=UPI001B8611AD|nr:regulator of Vps4 activity in the MVB pathway-domain-containing protein [Suillus clintonianus]KAG2157358.1 regulator of Vps4 activity in the MVB pathway-domain-containing protein [Suillus clintonianus]